NGLRGGNLGHGAVIGAMPGGVFVLVAIATGFGADVTAGADLRKGFFVGTGDGGGNRSGGSWSGGGGSFFGTAGSEKRDPEEDAERGQGCELRRRHVAGELGWMMQRPLVVGET